MRKVDLVEGAEVYYVAADGQWKHLPPTRATIVDPLPRRIVRRQCGAVELVSHHPDPAGTAVLVDLHEAGRVRRGVPVYRRHLRGLWKPTLAKLGRAEADVKAVSALLAEVAARPGDVSLAAVLGVAAADPALDHGVLAELAGLNTPAAIQ